MVDGTGDTDKPTIEDDGDAGEHGSSAVESDTSTESIDLSVEITLFKVKGTTFVEDRTDGISAATVSVGDASIILTTSG
jgi:hypothetical protein